MPGISIKSLDDSTFEVTVHDGTSTMHSVTVQPHYVRQLNATGVSMSELLRHCFEFLLEREPNTSILRSFDLSVIARYFPEFEHKIQQRLRGSTK